MFAMTIYIVLDELFTVFFWNLAVNFLFIYRVFHDFRA